ncbi:Translation_elongation factor [Hexamita inflata]|uniref:Translation elongation factor n=1 Tax=Hexamita inflata TaxID=28002 RepID=A0AA86P443_9EUKA|nr:Translation elongation factor [Hexamita inflata]
MSDDYNANRSESSNDGRNQENRYYATHNTFDQTPIIMQLSREYYEMQYDKQKLENQLQRILKEINTFDEYQMLNEDNEKIFENEEFQHEEFYEQEDLYQIEEMNEEEMSSWNGDQLEYEESFNNQQYFENDDELEYKQREYESLLRKCEEIKHKIQLQRELMQQNLRQRYELKLIHETREENQNRIVVNILPKRRHIHVKNEQNETKLKNENFENKLKNLGKKIVQEQQQAKNTAEDEAEQRQRVAKELKERIENENKDILQKNNKQHENQCSEKECKYCDQVLVVKCKTCEQIFCIQGQNVAESHAGKHIRSLKHEIDIDFEVSRRFNWEQASVSKEEETTKEYEKLEYERQSKVCQVETDDKSLQIKKFYEIENQMTLELQLMNKEETKNFQEELQQKADFFLDPKQINRKKLNFLMIESDEKKEKKRDKKEERLIEKTNQTSHQVQKRNCFNAYSQQLRQLEAQNEAKRLKTHLSNLNKILYDQKLQQNKFLESETIISAVKEQMVIIVKLIDEMKKLEPDLGYYGHIFTKFTNEIRKYLQSLSEISIVTLTQVITSLQTDINSELVQQNSELAKNGKEEIELLLEMQKGGKLFWKSHHEYLNKKYSIFKNLYSDLHRMRKNQSTKYQFKIVFSAVQKLLETQQDIVRHINTLVKILQNLTNPIQFKQQANILTETEEEKPENEEENAEENAENNETNTEFTVAMITDKPKKWAFTDEEIPNENTTEQEPNQINDQNQKDEEQSDNEYQEEPIVITIDALPPDQISQIIMMLTEIEEKLKIFHLYQQVSEQEFQDLYLKIEITTQQLERVQKYCNIDQSLKKQVNKDITENQNRIQALKTNDISKFFSKRHISIVFCGHVHHGKSTLSQQLLLESILDQNEKDQERQNMNEKNKTIANGLNSLPEERQTGNTIEYAKRQFDTNSGRHILLLDAPGHDKYILSMIQAATQADIGVLLTSAKQGEYEDGTAGADREAEKRGQTLEHAQILHTCGVSTIVVVVNKMDDISCQYSKEVFQNIIKKLQPQLEKIGFKSRNISFIPVSAKANVNVSRQLNESDISEYQQIGDFKQKILDFKKSQYEAEQKLFEWYKGFSMMDAIDNVFMPFRDIGGFVRVVINSKKKQGQQYFLECKVEKGQFNITDDNFVLMPTNKDIQLKMKDNETVFSGDQCVVTVDKNMYQQIKIGDIICQKGQECKTAMQFYIAFCCVETSSIICRGYRAMIHVGGIITEFEVADVVGMINEDGKLNEEVKMITTGQRAILKVKIIGRQNPICVSKFERDEFLGRVLIRHQRTTIGAGVVIEDWNDKVFQNVEENQNIQENQQFIFDRQVFDKLNNNIMVPTTKNYDKDNKKQGKKVELDNSMDQVKIWQMQQKINAIKTMPYQECVVTLFIRPSDSIPSIIKVLGTKKQETGNIKLDSTKSAAQSAIGKATQFVSSIQNIPANGICVFAGSELIVFEPFQPIVFNCQALCCDTKFNLEPVNELLKQQEQFIFVVFDGQSARIYKVSGNSIEQIGGEIEADLPNKGAFEQEVQIKNNRAEMRELYIKDIEKKLNDTITDSSAVKSIFLAYTSDFKDLVEQKFSPKLKNLIYKQHIELAYGFQHGLDYAMWELRKQLSKVTLIRQIEYCKKFIKIINDNRRKPEKYPKLYCYGLQNVVRCISQVKTVLVQEDFNCEYVEYEDNISFYTSECYRMLGSNHLVDSDGAQIMMCSNYKITKRQHIFNRFIDLGIDFVFVSCKTEVGNQFCKGFEGIGAILKTPE